MKRRFTIPAKKTSCESKVEPPPQPERRGEGGQGKAVKRRLEPETATKENDCPQPKAPRVDKSLKVSTGRVLDSHAPLDQCDDLVVPQPEEAPFFVIIGNMFELRPQMIF